MNIICSYSSLKKNGVLGINARNLNYIQKYNPRKFYPRADSKVLTKQIDTKANIPVPELYATISSIGQCSAFFEKIKDLSDFVIKPEHGAGGEGVFVLKRVSEDSFSFPSGKIITRDQLRLHLANIINGLYSLGGQPDRALVEYRVQFDSIFKDIAYQGVPDIRIIVFQGVPAMAMLRLPTKASSGRANLHQGAVGAGVLISSGITTNGVVGTESIELHPDTKKPIANLQIPYWNQILSIACKSYDLFELGYLGIDIVIDKEVGPLVLEVNVRPGLSIQLANKQGLLKKLQEIEKSMDKLQTFEDRINFIKTYPDKN